MGEFGVSDKEPKRNSTSSLGLGGVKVQQTLEAFPSKAMMTVMLHHNHHHRPFLPFDGDGVGPTPYYNTSLTHHINAVSGVTAPALSAAAIDGCGAAAVRTLQPFDISAITTTPSPFIKSTGGMMAASLGYSFTSAQWKELQRQAMIYKYMMASVPVPPDLLIPTSATPSRCPLDGGGGFNLRLSNSTDPEPGRCRRTDGKKWRCARDVAPNHKYCERHMNRGRPRSRKPVEVHTNNNDQQIIKRARHDCNHFPTSGVSVAVSNNPIITRKDESSSTQYLVSPTSQPYLQSSLSLDDNYGVKAANFGSVASVSSNKEEPRGLEWMLNGDPISLGASDSEWHSLMHDKVGLTTTMSSCNNTESPHYLNSFPLYNSPLDQQNSPPLALNPLLVRMGNLQQSEKPRRGFIDAWSNNTETEESNANNKNSVASLGKLSLSSLDLSMGGGGGSVHEDMGTIEMGLGLIMEPDGGNTQNNGTKPHLSNWLTPAAPCWLSSTTPGGPLAEVLRPSTTVTATNEANNSSNPSSPVMTNVAESSSPLGTTMVSSPSGVLQKTLASFSDSSSNSSPTVASSRANSEMVLLRFNHK